METAILSPLIIEHIIGSGKYWRMYEPFGFRSKVLYDLGLQYECWAPKGFVYDQESVPLLRGTCPPAGAGHDLLCRINSVPVVSKFVAAKVYFELLEYVYSIDDTNTLKSDFDQLREFSVKWIKTGAVVVAEGYFHKLKVEATYEEVLAAA